MTSTKPGRFSEVRRGCRALPDDMRYFAGLLLLTLSVSANATAQSKILPGSAARGERVLFDKGCINCHGLTGTASDLSRTPRHAVTPDSLAAEMWNNMTAMWATPDVAQKAQITSTEAADLFAYLYSSLYFALPGSVSRGKAVFERKNCANCHSDAVAAWEAVNDPIVWAERMWNHSAEMAAAMVRKGFLWPRFSDQEVADLMIYLRSLPELRLKSGSFRIGEPERGRLVFDRSCTSCHSFGRGPDHTIDLLGRPAPLTVTGYIASMWNHALTMQARSGDRFPTLQSGEMSDLIAFLFSESYFFQRGDTVRGKRVFENKRCARCHEERRKETGAPDLRRPSETYSPITLMSAVSRHGPAMAESMRQNGISWPRFQGSEMADLIAYLNSRE